MDKKKILVVDDEKDICDILQFNLENEGYIVDVAYSAEEALDILTPNHQLILLDVMMGGMSGFKMAERLRKKDKLVPIIFLTAKDTEDDMLTGFSIGGDDYISKPFSIKELLARIKALITRSNIAPQAPMQEIWQYKGIVIDYQSNRVLVDNIEVSLTKKEFEILSLLAKAAPNLMSRSSILNQVWADNELVLDRTVDVHITRLRKKLGEYSSLIVNRSGFGYYLDIE